MVLGVPMLTVGVEYSWNMINSQGIYHEIYCRITIYYKLEVYNHVYERCCWICTLV